MFQESFKHILCRRNQSPPPRGNDDTDHAGDRESELRCDRAACRLVDDDETGSLPIHRGTQGARFALIERRKGGLRPDILNDADATLGGWPRLSLPRLACCSLAKAHPPPHR